MKQLIYKDLTSEANLNQNLTEALEAANNVLEQYNRTTLKPITDMKTLQQFFADPVKFISDQLQATANLPYKVNPQKFIELLEDEAITSLLSLANTPINLDYLFRFGKFTKKSIEVDTTAWAAFVDQQVCVYATTPAQLKAFEALQKLITAIEDLHTLGMRTERLINQPLGAQGCQLLKYNGEQHPATINIFGYNQLSR
jgi:hypothetical protein